MFFIAAGTDRKPVQTALSIHDAQGGYRLAEVSPKDASLGIAVFVPLGRSRCLFLTNAALEVTLNDRLLRGGVALLSHADRISLGGQTLTVQVRTDAIQTQWSAEETQRCPICHVSIQTGDDVILCGKCATPHHIRCFHARNGRCGLFGCLAVTHLSEPVERER